jgi:hypothetical protein
MTAPTTMQSEAMRRSGALFRPTTMQARNEPEEEWRA